MAKVLTKKKKPMFNKETTALMRKLNYPILKELLISYDQHPQLLAIVTSELLKRLLDALEEAKILTVKEEPAKPSKSKKKLAKK